MSLKILEWSGSVIALLGSFLIATHGTWADYGFLAYLVSNAFLIVFFIRKKLFGVLTMQLGATVTSLYGIMNSQF